MVVMTPRLQQICNGETDLPLSKVNAYRSAMGMDALEDDGKERKSRVVHAGNAEIPRPRTKKVVQRPATSGCPSCGSKRKSHANGSRDRLTASSVKWSDSVPPIVTIQTAIRTAFRSDPTLDKTVQSMIGAGFQSPIVFAEPDSPDSELISVRWESQLKPFKSFVESSQWLLQNTGSQWFLLCEDDVIFRDGAADLIRTYPMSNDQVLSLYVSSFQQGRVSRNEGFHAVTGDLHGSLAYLVHRESLVKILDSRTFRTWPGPARVDRAFSQAATECGVELVTHNPSLVQHIGAASTLNPRRKLTHGRTSHFVKKRHTSPSLTLLTPTGDRPEAFALCERWIANQRYTGDFTWIVADDGVNDTLCTMDQTVVRRKPGKGHTLCAQLRDTLPLVGTDLMLIIEDDEYYGPDYLSTMVGQLEHAELVGERASKYYFPRQRYWMQYPSWHHVALCRMGWRRSVIPTVIEAVTGTDHRSVDLRVWNAWNGTRRVWVDTVGDMRLSVGIKGMPGRKCGIAKPRPGSIPDPDAIKLRQMLGDDANAYLDMYDERMPGIVSQAAGFISTAAKHIAGGAVKADEETVRKRLSICEKCPLLQSSRKCKACGCPVDRKAQWEVSECPKKKW